MKLATLKDGSRDGMLAVVSRDQKTAHLADGIAPTLQRALDDWPFIAPQLEDLSLQLNSGRSRRPFEFVPANCMAPLPRAHQWLDGSVYVQHVELLTRAISGKLPDNLWREPMMYQGGADDFLGPCDPAVFAEEHWGIDFEPELGVILGDTPMQVRKDDALDQVRLLVLVNDWSLRNLIAAEIGKGFGFLQSKPATGFAPLAVTPDEIGEGWAGGLAHLGVAVDWNGVRFMNANAGGGTRFSFTELIAHAAKTRNLRAGTIIGSGTISSGGNVGCVAELRAREALEAADDKGRPGRARTEFMKFGDRVRIEAFDAAGSSVFGAIDQEVASLRKRRAPGAAHEELHSSLPAVQDAVLPASNAVEPEVPHATPAQSGATEEVLAADAAPLKPAVDAVAGAEADSPQAPLPEAAVPGPDAAPPQSA